VLGIICLFRTKKPENGKNVKIRAYICISTYEIVKNAGAIIVK